MDKSLIRQRILERRSAMSGGVRAAKQASIFRNLMTIPQLQTALTVFLYLDFRGEVETDEIFRWGWQTGKRMAVPVTVIQERKLIPVELHSFEDLEIGAYGIREPRIQHSGSLVEGLMEHAVPVSSIDVVLVPGVAFDLQGGRLGYGGGYYDRFLPMLRSDAVKIGLAFDLQLVDRLPVEEHDIHLDYVVTESSVIHCSST
ncbi:5-formyltetrahydrofolate cyclo-ligase [Effusibacillus lacus]|uniref:5-formyltetrahydrofolate cyclo-ligase n=1 Tax=Effusibacillus lacus TaxID=1348429 RepID=A0A292YIR7_9BACL|nr:5-formyltetrahydrofolate cyclo-ligase [Effusibacillus lacus]TCS74332.1 5-formyltetrahydrofolate cyclo-ligase [Effusibacillus lacus]GAX88789.1 5-formyltetrahydrofolate cyclo-ligase [Effusibacillus lacus]